MARKLGAVAIVAAFGVLAVGATASPTLLVTVNTVTNSSLGTKILVSSGGRTLYHTSSEAGKTVKCTGACATEWPPLLVAKGGKPIAGPGVATAKLSTVKRPDGKLQVTYSGKPLYLYAGDKKAGSVKGQGEAGIWHVLAPTGAVITKAVTTSTSGSSGSTGSTSSSSSSSGSSGSNIGGSNGNGITTPAGCDTNPGGYGCM
jgi:predicted lipoprotein with Yx(FWY)xxD motif